MKKIILALALLLTSCSYFQTEQVPMVPLKLKEPKELKIRNTTFYVLTSENAKSQFEKAGNAGEGEALFCLGETGYHAMADNMLEIQKYIILERKIIQSYKEYYESN